MTTCNRNRIVDLVNDTIDTAESEANLCTESECCEDGLTLEGDIQDFLTDIGETSWHEIIDFENCEDDISLVTDAEALWQAFEGELKTPYGVIDTPGQSTYGSEIWSAFGQQLTTMLINKMTMFINEQAAEYPEINNVLDASFRQTKDHNQLQVAIELDTIYGTFTGYTRLIKNPELQF